MLSVCNDWRVDELEDLGVWRSQLRELLGLAKDFRTWWDFGAGFCRQCQSLLHTCIHSLVNHKNYPSPSPPLCFFFSFFFLFGFVNLIHEYCLSTNYSVPTGLVCFSWILIFNWGLILFFDKLTTKFENLVFIYLVELFSCCTHSIATQ